MGHSLKVVVVDDKVMITDLFESYFKIALPDLSVKVFNNALEALDYFQTTEDIDVVITDYNMPGVNGIELLEATNPKTKRIMISGFVSDIAEDKLNDLNAVFFEKPVPMKKLGSIIEDMMRS